MTTIATKYPFIGSIETRQGGRKENQDNAGFVDTPLGLLLVVCDGMGGGPGGRTASLMAVDTILTVLADVSEHTPREAALQFAIDKANDIIYTKAKETPELRGMGTTVAAVLINENSAVIAHVGDSRIYQLRKGAIVFRSADHSVVANLVRQKRLTEEEARNHPQSNVITRALGIKPSMEIEFDEVSFHRGDRFVLCTDGIWGMMPQRDLVQSLSRVMGINELTSLMAEEIDELGKKSGGGHDNLTLAILDTSFDSVQKKNHKKDTDGGAIASNTETPKRSNWKKVLFVCIPLCFIAMVAIYIYNSDMMRHNVEQNSSKGKGETVTTVINKVEIRKDGTDTLNRVAPDTGISDINMFKDPLITEDSILKIIEQNLDSLTKIKDRNTEKARQLKREYVNDVIIPNVRGLEEKVAPEEKKKDIEQIIKMLNSTKTVQASTKGETTAEGLDHIKEIKKKLKNICIKSGN